MKAKAIVRRSQREMCRRLCEDLPEYFSVTKLRNRILASVRGEQRYQALNVLKNEIVLNSVYTAVMKVLVHATAMVQLAVREKFVVGLQRWQFPPLKDPQAIAEYLLNELFEAVFDYGPKNV